MSKNDKKKNSVRSYTKEARIAAQVLSDPKESKKAKGLAGSVLSNRKKR